MSKSYNRDYFLNRKLKWEKNHGKFIHEFMFNEYQERILGQCNVALNDLQRQLDEEIARAKAEEARLDQKIDAETTRAKAEEVRLDGKIDSETSRAKAEETRLDGKIDAETVRATGEETRLDGKIDTEKTRLDGKIDTEISRATGRENELATSINACLPKAGGTMKDSGVIKWNHEEQNPNADPFTLGGLVWNGATDYLSIKGEITGNDNMNLAINLGDDNSNAIVIKDKDNAEVASINAHGVYTGTIDWSHINNRPEIDKQALDKADAYTVDKRYRLVKISEQADLMSSYNSTLMSIVQAINMHTQALKDLGYNIDELQGKTNNM